MTQWGNLIAYLIIFEPLNFGIAIRHLAFESSNWICLQRVLLFELTIEEPIGIFNSHIYEGLITFHHTAVLSLGFRLGSTYLQNTSVLSSL